MDIDDATIEFRQQRLLHHAHVAGKHDPFRAVLAKEFDQRDLARRTEFFVLNGEGSSGRRGKAESSGSREDPCLREIAGDENDLGVEFSREDRFLQRDEVAALPGTKYSEAGRRRHVIAWQRKQQSATRADYARFLRSFPIIAAGEIKDEAQKSTAGVLSASSIGRRTRMPGISRPPPRMRRSVLCTTSDLLTQRKSGGANFALAVFRARRPGQTRFPPVRDKAPGTRIAGAVQLDSQCLGKTVHVGLGRGVKPRRSAAESDRPSSPRLQIQPFFVGRAFRAAPNG